MTEGYTISVMNTNMLSIFSGVDIEHPYRFQPYIRFVVKLEEYKKFIKSMVDLSISWLKFGIDSYAKALLSESDTLLIRLFMFDISKAIVNELLLSIANNVDGTIICHSFKDNDGKDYGDDTKHIRFEEVSNELLSFPVDEIKKAVTSLKDDMFGYIDTASLSEHNLLLFRYALLLRTMCYTKKPYKFELY